MYHLTVIQDSREHKGHELPFPDHIKVYLRRSKKPTLIKISVEVETMPAGDYTLKGFDKTVLVETKRSALEVSENLLSADYQRASRAFYRLSSSTQHPILVLEFGQGDFFGLSDGNGERTLDALGGLVAHHRFTMWVAGPRHGDAARKRTAECVLRMMIQAVELECPNFLHGVPE